MATNNPKDCPCYGQYPQNDLNVCLYCQEAIIKHLESHSCTVKYH